MTDGRAAMGWSRTTDDIGVRCKIMRGGTSKGIYLLAEDLPDQRAARDDLLRRLLGSPNAGQTDGLGSLVRLSVGRERRLPGVRGAGS